MKIKKMSMKKNGDLLLKTTLGKHDNFDYATAVRLSNNTINGLIRFTFNGDDRRPVIYYNITGMQNLPVFLENKLSLTQFKSLIESLLTALETVSTSGLAEKNLLLSPEYVYVDEDASIHLAYLPLSGLVANERSVLELLGYVTVNTMFVNDENKQYAADILSYIRRQQVFSLVEVKAFLNLTPVASQAQNGQAEQLFERPKAFSGRDFVSEATGIPAIERLRDSRSVAENVAEAISADLTLANHPGRVMQSAKQFYLTRINDGQQWTLHNEKTLIGRSISSDIRLDATAISRQHAELTITSDHVSIEDLGSANGTYINGERLNTRQRVVLQSNDTILLGNIGFRISEY
jgi:hypothetical protein